MVVVRVRTKTEVRNRDKSASYAKSSGKFRQIQAKLGVDGLSMDVHGQTHFVHGWTKIGLSTGGRPWTDNGQTPFVHGLSMSMSRRK